MNDKNITRSAIITLFVLLTACSSNETDIALPSAPVKDTTVVNHAGNKPIKDDVSKSASTTDEEKLTQCTGTRPEMCIELYKPVCAQVDTGVRCITTPCPSNKWKTYSNSCKACADKKVIAHKANAC